MSEPKVEEWIDRVAGTAATMLLGKTSSWSNVREAIALALARHTPKPEDQPIRRGDVVQFKPPHPRCGGFDVIEATDESGACEVWGYGTVHRDDIARIGRAKFMPDGTKVED